MALFGSLRRSLRRLRAQDDSAKQRWIAVAGGGLALAVIALWVAYIVAAMPTILNGPERKGAASAVGTAIPVNQPGDTGDIFTRSLRHLRDEFALQWDRAHDRIDSFWGNARDSFEAIDQAPPATPTP